MEPRLGSRGPQRCRVIGSKLQHDNTGGTGHKEHPPQCSTAQTQSVSERECVCRVRPTNEGCSPRGVYSCPGNLGDCSGSACLAFALTCPISRPKVEANWNRTNLINRIANLSNTLASGTRHRVTESTSSNRLGQHAPPHIDHRAHRPSKLETNVDPPSAWGQAGLGLTLPREVDRGAHQARPPCCSTIHRPRSMIHRLLS